jgi:hypothetical protein
VSELNFADYAGTYRSIDSDKATFANLDRYYRGAQPLRFLHPDLRAALGKSVPSLAVNIPRKVVDALENRLDVEGFRLRGADQALSDLWDIWQANGLDSSSQQGHLAALIHGRSFVLIGENVDEPSTPIITVESSAQVGVKYDYRSRRVVSAVKRWTEGDTTHATFYGLNFTYQMSGLTEQLTRTGGLGFNGGWKTREEAIQNTLGVVPVVPFVNRQDLLRPFGESEMTDVLGLTDAITKLCLDMVLTAEAMAAPRRWATGIDLGGSDAESDRTQAKIKERWEEASLKKVWLAEDSSTEFGQFEAAPLSNYVAAIDALTAKAAALGNLPGHYIGHVTSNPASADAIRSSEAPLVEAARRKMKGFGEAWEQVMRLAVLVRDGVADPALRSLETIWRDPETPTVAQKADAAMKLTAAGVIDVEQAQEDLGYSPVQIERMRERRAKNALGPVAAQLDEAQRLQSENGLSQQAAFAAVGLLQAANAIGQTPP